MIYLRIQYLRKMWYCNQDEKMIQHLHWCRNTSLILFLTFSITLSFSRTCTPTNTHKHPQTPTSSHPHTHTNIHTQTHTHTHTHTHKKHKHKNKFTLFITDISDHTIYFQLNMKVFISNTFLRSMYLDKDRTLNNQALESILGNNFLLHNISIVSIRFWILVLKPYEKISYYPMVKLIWGK